MSLAQRTASAEWHGTLASGSGVTTSDSGAFKDLDMNWASRSEDADGSTSPEELLAAAHASCYAMAFSLVLASEGHKPETLKVTGTTSLEKQEIGYKVTESKLEVTGSAEDISAEDFERLAQEADKGCPISNALRDNVDIKVEAKLDA